MCVIAFHQVQPVPEQIKKSAIYLTGELSRPLGAASLAWLILALVSDAWDSTTSFESEFESPLCSTIFRMQVTQSSPHRENLLLLALRMRESLLLDIPPMQWKDIKDAIVS
jgi:hypothetical protein